VLSYWSDREYFGVCPRNFLQSPLKSAQRRSATVAGFRSGGIARFHAKKCWWSQVGQEDAYNGKGIPNRMISASMTSYFS